MAKIAIAALIWLACAGWSVRKTAQVDGEVTMFVGILCVLFGPFGPLIWYWMNFWEWLPSFERNRFGEIVLWSRKSAPHPQQKERTADGRRNAPTS